MNDWKLKVWKQKKICLRFGVSSFCLICSTVMIQTVWYRMKMLEYILILVFIISLLKTLIAFFSLSLNIISLWAFLREFLFYFHFSFSVAIRKKSKKIHPDTNVQSKNRQEQKKINRFSFGSCSYVWWLLVMASNCLWRNSMKFFFLHIM